jgi:hypothetical protein
MSRVSEDFGKVLIGFLILNLTPAWVWLFSAIPNLPTLLDNPLQKISP